MTNTTSSRVPVAGLLILVLLAAQAAYAVAAEPPENPCERDPESQACRMTDAVQPFEDYHKRVRSAEMVTPLGSDVFGDSTSLYNGSTGFTVVDID